MNDLLARLRTALEGLSPRERMLVGLAGGAFVVVLLWFGVVNPLFSKGAQANARLAAAERELEAVQRLRQQYDELGSRLSHFEEEVTTLKEEATVAAKQEEEQLVARAHLEAQRIRDTAEKNIHEELVRAQEALRKDAVDLAVDLAEGTLKKQVGTDDRRRLSREFLDALQTDGGNGHG